MLKDKLNEQLKDAMRAKDEVRVSTIRLLLSALNYEQIAKQRELTEDDEISIVRRQLKQREEAVDAYEKGGRLDAAEKEKQEAVILKEFLPAQMSEQELSGIVQSAIEETGAASSADFGKVMQAVMGKVQGRADGKTVSEMVRRKLG